MLTIVEKREFLSDKPLGFRKEKSKSIVLLIRAAIQNDKCLGSGAKLQPRNILHALLLNFFLGKTVLCLGEWAEIIPNNLRASTGFCRRSLAVIKYVR